MDTVYPARAAIRRDPLFDDIDVIGLYPADHAAHAARGTASDPGSGPCAPDD